MDNVGGERQTCGKSWNLWLEYLLQTPNCLSSRGLLNRCCQNINFTQFCNSVGFHGYRVRAGSLDGARKKSSRRIEMMRTAVVESNYEQQEVLQSQKDAKNFSCT